MAKLLVRCMGQASGPKTKYLYRNGNWLVDYDNTGYALGPSYTVDGGFTIGATQMSCDVLSTNHTRAVTTALPIDLSQYDYLVVKYNNGSVITIDITSVNVGAYITVGRWADGPSAHYACACVSNQKNNYVSNRINDAYFVAPISVSPLTVQEIYLATIEQ